MIGVKSLAATTVTAVAVAAAAWRGRLGSDYLATLGPTSCFAIGLFAGLATALVAVGWRPREPSRLAVALRGARVVVVAADAPRELPSAVQRALVMMAFACVGLAVFTNPGTARLLAIPHDFDAPSPGEYCRPPRPVAATATPAPPPKPVEMPGCALVKRAFALGLTKDLGSCAPREAPPAVRAAIAAQAPCTLRQIDEPYLHFAWRRLAGATGAAASANPVDAVSAGIDTKRIQLAHLDALLAAQRHAVTGTPHASHHIFVTLPDPAPRGALARLLAPERCDGRYADVPLWPPAGGSPSTVVDQVLGQLLFAARFGTTASCRDYTIHWGAAPTTCAELAADPVRFLAGHDLAAPVRDVLDRRARRIELAALDAELGRKTPPPPPPASAIVSFACVVVDPTASAGAATGQEVAIDGEAVAVREVRIAAVATEGAGVIEVYDRLAALLAGEDAGRAVIDAGAPPPELDLGELSHDEYLLVRLDRLHDADPFAGHTWPLDRADVREVYPLERHLGGFIDAFRRRYRAQRGRL